MRSVKKILSLVLSLAMLAGMLTVGAFAAAAVSTPDGVQLQFGDPEKDPTWPESEMAVTGANGVYTADYTGADAAYYYPGTLSLYAMKAGADLTLTCGANVKIATYQDTVETLHSTITSATNINDGVTSDIFTVKLTGAGAITITGAGGTNVLSFSAPKSDYPPAAPGATPAALNGYLPLGQYARGSGWGSPYSDGTTLDGVTPKVVGGYSSTGVSLGAGGGYVQYEMADYITDNPANPYGVDFIVYGNAFNGNPEAASVQVSRDGSTWYELAGSKYYDANSLRNVDVTYTLSGTNINYAIARSGSSANLLSGTFKANAATWFPTQANYNNALKPVWKLAAAPVTVGATQFNANTVKYSGVTMIQDSDTTNDYQFGYADVHVNGGAYGTAVNPYTITNTAQGGDGFDLAWAVDQNGNPVQVSSVKYIRVYTSALLNAGATGVPTPGIFGETSAEVCGIYVATGNTGLAANSDLEIWNGSTPIEIADKGVKEFTLTPGTTISLDLVTTANTMFVNSTNVPTNSMGEHESTISVGYTASGAVSYYRVITQTGEEAPHLVLLKFICA